MRKSVQFQSKCCVALLLLAGSLSAATVYVPNYGSSGTLPSNVSVVDTGSNTVTATITVGIHPEATAVTPQAISVCP
ncbi:MAG: hypothetical protein KGI80_06055 [Verrucomicrobiota bacterium]|nr:hypothetical protein [Verrucomicrobiota bacterium]